MIDRRSFLQLALAAQAFAVLPARASAPGLRMGEPQPFSYDWLKSHAQALAGAAYSPPPRPDPKIVSSIDYDAHGQIHYKTDFALFGDGEPGAYPVTSSMSEAVFPQDPFACTAWSGAGARTLPAKFSTIPAISIFRLETSQHNCL